MAITVNNGVANIVGTPGAISGVFSNRPAAADVAEGTLYFSTDTAAIYQVVSGSWIIYTGGGGGSQNLQQVLNVGNTAIDTNIALSDSAGFATIINVDNITNSIQSRIAANYVGTQKIGFDDYIYLTTAGNTPYLINHNDDNDRESRFYSDFIQYKDLVSGAILTVNAPNTINNNTINFQNGTGTLAFLSDILTPGIDDVLAVSQSFTNNRTIDVNNFDFLTENIKIFPLKDTSTLAQFNLSQNQIQFFSNSLGFQTDNGNTVTIGDLSLVAGFVLEMDITNDRFSVIRQTAINGLDINFSGGYYQLGDFDSLLNNTSIQINDQGNQIFTTNQSTNIGFDLNFSLPIFRFGDYNGTNFLSIDISTGDTLLKASNNITLYQANAGLILTNGTSLLCDPDGNGNSSFFGLDDNAETLVGSANLITASASGNSGQHLKINIAGTDYVITLNNP